MDGAKLARTLHISALVPIPKSTQERCMTKGPSESADTRFEFASGGVSATRANRLEARDALALQYRPYVYKVARELVARMRAPLDVEDLAGWGCLGLLEAADRFDEGRGVRFRSYAHARIRGAMLDAIRAYYGRRASAGAGEDDLMLPRVTMACADTSYAAYWYEGSDEVPDRSDELPGAHRESPDWEIYLGETRRLLDQAIGVLSPLERTVIVQHYVHGETVCAIARRHRLSKSWLSRVHARAVGKLREAYSRLENAGDVRS
jgi:RNA polymerase sigma factor for flagellar operon FliA